MSSAIPKTSTTNDHVKNSLKEKKKIPKEHKEPKENVDLPAPVVDTENKKPKEAKEKKEKKVKEDVVKNVEVKVEPPVVVEPEVVEGNEFLEKVDKEVAPVENVSIHALLNEFQLELAQAYSILSSVKTKFNIIKKVVHKELKNSHKKRKHTNTTQYGILQPTIISDELADFLKKPKGHLMSRTQVTKEVSDYIKLNGLKDPANGRNINPDKLLSNLLNQTDDKQLSFFNLQHYLKKHYPNTGLNKKNSKIVPALEA
jgi:chromatin remodeling complex protein RSC6